MITTESLLKPKIKIVAVQDDYDINKLSDKIKKQNFSSLLNPEFKILHKNLNKFKSSWILHAEVNSEVYNYIATTKKIFVNESLCKVYDDIHVLRCFKCCRYGHISKNCDNHDICHICAIEHDNSNKCNSNLIKCINCILYNKEHGTKVQTNHTASDTTNCYVYSLKKEQIINKSDYSTHPLLS